jgi:hypothetical protein
MRGSAPCFSPAVGANLLPCVEQFGLTNFGAPQPLGYSITTGRGHAKIRVKLSVPTKKESVKKTEGISMETLVASFDVFGVQIQYWILVAVLTTAVAIIISSRWTGWV